MSTELSDSESTISTSDVEVSLPLIHFTIITVKVAFVLYNHIILTAAAATA
jgi:hypothetical protein